MTDELARALEARAEYWEDKCNRLHYGACQTVGCLKRGGWVRGDPVDYDMATCETFQACNIDRAAAARLRDLEAALAWVSEVHPDTLPNGGAVVEMTWDEFNVMRAVLGKNPLKPAPALRALTGGGHG